MAEMYKCDYITSNTIYVKPNYQDQIKKMLSGNYGKYVLLAGTKKIIENVEEIITSTYFDGIDVMPDTIGVK